MSQDWLLTSDVVSGIVAGVFNSVSGLDKKMYQPVIENIVLSIVARMGESKLQNDMLKTASVRGAIIIFVSSLIIHKGLYSHSNAKSLQHALQSIGSDAISDEFVSGFLKSDTVLIPRGKA